MTPQMGVATAVEIAAAVAAHNALTIVHGTVDDVADQTDIATHAAIYGLHARVVRKAANQTVNNSTVLVDDTHLFFAMAANEVWLVELHLIGQFLAASDFKYAFSVPAGCTGSRFRFAYSATSVQMKLTAAPATTDSPTLAAASTLSQRITAIIVNGATAGDFQLQWAQNVAVAENTIVLANSCIIAHRLA